MKEDYTMDAVEEK